MMLMFSNLLVIVRDHHAIGNGRVRFNICMAMAQNDQTPANGWFNAKYDNF